ncbi:hypothetical protein TELCIR_13902 [Teladorsagia circumcincta]|uniref:Peptidase M12A domain-containing protein n=1 Tax=Teladorsagia circumcincta TaxID=45464 RepID=A0A2G9U2H7_TELCI|nr:hypothetical protein TELCIR_13902 [Teladorsagia circumcincta]
MNWNAWPSVLWVEGVNYYFDSSIPDQTKRAFLDAAKQWESHTCINFTENPTGEVHSSVHLIESYLTLKRNLLKIYNSFI